MNLPMTYLNTVFKAFLKVHVSVDESYVRTFHKCHKLLVEKFNHYRARDVGHKWFESYLSDRFQRLHSAGGFLSDLQEIDVEVPQSSILPYYSGFL